MIMGRVTSGKPFNGTVNHLECDVMAINSDVAFRTRTAASLAQVSSYIKESGAVARRPCSVKGVVQVAQPELALPTD